MKMRDEQKEARLAKSEAKATYEAINKISVPKLDKVKETRPLKVWWFPQLPCKAFEQEVCSVREGALLLHTLAKYDHFQLAHSIKPDFCNTGSLMVKADDGEWEDWEDEEGRSIDDLVHESEGS